MRHFLSAAFLIFGAHAACAAVPTRESIDTLLTITRVEKTLDAFMVNMDAVRKQVSAQAFAGRSITPEQERVRDALNEKMTRILREEMNWPTMEALYVQVYQETFTQDEIDGLIAFYRTPIGMAYTDKQPIVQQKTLAATQAMLGPMMLKLQAAAKEAMDDAKAAKP